MAAVTTFVVDEADVEPVREDGDTASERLTFEVEHLVQRVLRFAPGSSREREAGSRHELLYVAPGESWSVENPGPGELLLVAVSATADLPVDDNRRKRTIRFADQPEHTAS